MLKLTLLGRILINQCIKTIVNYAIIKGKVLNQKKKKKALSLYLKSIHVQSPIVVECKNCWRKIEDNVT
jgi:hypothetical protein